VVKGIGLYGGYRDLSGNINSGTNSYSITDGCKTYIEADDQALTDFNTIKNPFSVKTTESIRIYIKDSNQFLIAQIETGITFTATKGSISEFGLTPDNTIASTLTAVTIAFLPKHELLAGTSQIEITLPIETSIAQQTDSSTCSITDLKMVSPTAKCTVVDRTITLLNPFSVAYVPSASQIISFKIAGMTNPSTTRPVSEMTVTTKIGTSTLYLVDESSQAELFSASAGTLLEASVSPDNLQTYTSTKYTFSFKTQHKVAQNGYITVDLPSQVSFVDPSTSAASCTRISGLEGNFKV
jgi:hypothetical protein